MPVRRLVWLDGLRGVAALLVVFLHLSSAFLPALALVDLTVVHYGWEMTVVHTPLFVLINGYASVFVFFLISGVALTYAYASQYRSPFVTVARRLVRLGLPMAAALVLGAGLLHFWPDSHRDAAAITQSLWLRIVCALSPDWTSLGHQIFGEGMLLGYRETSLLPVAMQQMFGVDTLLHSFDPPLWTLHIELAGSLLVLVAVMARHFLPQPLYWCGLAGAVALLIASPLVLFLVGHVLANWTSLHDQPRSGTSRGRLILGSVSFLAGIGLCTGVPLPGAVSVQLFLPGPALGTKATAYQLQLFVASTLIVTGCVLLPAVQTVLRTRVPQALGQLSFSLYLVHLPILFTVVSLLFARVYPVLGYGAAAALCAGICLVLAMAAAWAFAAGVDRPAIRLSRALRRRAPERYGIDLLQPRR